MNTYEMEAVLDETVKIACFPWWTAQRRGEASPEKHQAAYWNAVRMVLKQNGALLNVSEWNKEALLMHSRNAFEVSLGKQSATAPVVGALRRFVLHQCSDRLANVVFWTIVDVKDDEKVFRLLLRSSKAYIGVIVPGQPYLPTGWYVNDWIREERMSKTR